MWREYFGFAGTSFAVINGLIAITIALLPMRRSVYKLRLGAAALVLRRARRRRDVLRPGTAPTFRSSGSSPTAPRSACGFEDFIAEGRGLLGQIKDAERELPTTAADQWAQRVEIYLRDKLGERAIARFRKDAQRTLRRRRHCRRAAVGLLARGAQPCRQSGSDRRGIRRAAAAAAD